MHVSLVAELKAEVVDKARQAEAAQAKDAQTEASIADLEAKLAAAKQTIEELQATAVASDIKEREQEYALAALQTATETKEEHIKDRQDEPNALEEANKAAEEAVKHKGSLAAVELSKDALAMLEASLEAKETAALAQQQIQATQLALNDKCGSIEERKDARAALKLVPWKASKRPSN
ncbi:hypothetical protein KCU88_g7140, partial [Aureobasidium melanogenum]